MHKIPREIKVYAIKAALEAGTAIMRHYKNNSDTQHKSDGSPVTIADREASERIAAVLIESGIPVIGEERKKDPYAKRRKWKEFWLVDPLDGTKEFLKENDEFTVNIAYCQESIPRLGVIYIPCQNLIYLGDAIAKKVYRLQVETGEQEALDLLERADPLPPPLPPGKNLRLAVSRYHPDPYTQSFIHNLKDLGYEVSPVAAGSAYKFCLLAEGLVDIYPRFTPTMEWDTASGHAICMRWDGNSSNWIRLRN